MATKLPFTAAPSAVGDVSIAFGSAPIGGFTAQATLGTATNAVVRLWVRTHADAAFVIADTLSLSSGGATSLTVPVYPAYEEAKFEVTSITGGTVRLTAIGVGA